MDTAQARFEQLFGVNEHLVRAYCARRVPTDVVDDVLADTFAVAWRKFDDVPPDAVLPWLYSVAYRVIQHEWRSAGRLARLRSRTISLVERPSNAVADQFEEDDDRRKVLEAASRLPDDDQEILRLTLWEEITPTAAAVVLGITADAAKQRASRARKRLADEFHRLSQSPDVWRAPAGEGS